MFNDCGALVRNCFQHKYPVDCVLLLYNAHSAMVYFCWLPEVSGKTNGKIPKKQMEKSSTRKVVDKFNLLHLMAYPKNVYLMEQIK